MQRSTRTRPRSVRSEHFGAIVQLEHPRALVFVDREFARRTGSDSHRWKVASEDADIGARPLSAPLEAHLQITNRCSAGCTGCYTAASPQAGREWGLEGWKACIDELAEMGVFHLALGGGESADVPWLGELVEHARRRGLVPNLTTSGLSSLHRIVTLAPLFGQINVSLDGLGDDYARVRGFDGFAAAERALRLIRKRTRNVGINVVVTRHNFDRLEEIVAFARRRRLNEVELLRFKPAGRGIQAFSDMTCTDEQHRAFFPLIKGITRRQRIRVRVDCSYTPMLAYHHPDAEILKELVVYGCTGGDFLVGAKAGGQVTACSFAAPPPEEPRGDSLRSYWDTPGAFGAFRSWRKASEPCASCEYLALCRGGCRVVSRHLTGDLAAPDPECPRVVDAKGATVPRRNPLPVLG